MMDNEQHQQFASVLYSVHEQLRRRKRQAKNEEEWEQAWKEHKNDSETLQEYSRAMHDLATKIWDPRNKLSTNASSTAPIKEEIDHRESKIKCRLEWVILKCRDHFELSSKTKLKLLDVGSCYNPFSVYGEFFDIVALDLCPAPGFEDQIFQCDFLEVEAKELETEVLPPKESSSYASAAVTSLNINSTIVEPGKVKNLKHMPANYFDVVVFSYFLEYLADAKQRVECCMKAHKLLKSNGLLFILRPDSNKVTPGGNSRLLKRMKLGMLTLGFRRVNFEKLEHLWCMAFRKISSEETDFYMKQSYFKKDIEKLGINPILENEDRLHELFIISQDCKENFEDEDCLPRKEGTQ